MEEGLQVLGWLNDIDASEEVIIVALRSIFCEYHVLEEEPIHLPEHPRQDVQKDYQDKAYFLL